MPKNRESRDDTIYLDGRDDDIGGPVMEDGPDTGKKRQVRKKSRDLILPPALITTPVDVISGMLPEGSVRPDGEDSVQISLFCNLFPSEDMFGYSGSRLWLISCIFDLGLGRVLLWPPREVGAKSVKENVSILLNPIQAAFVLDSFIRKISSIVTRSPVGAGKGGGEISRSDRVVLDFISRYGQENLPELLLSISKAMSSARQIEKSGS